MGAVAWSGAMRDIRIHATLLSLALLAPGCDRVGEYFKGGESKPEVKTETPPASPVATPDVKADVTVDVKADVTVDVTVGVIMGSKSDWDTMRHAAEVLREFAVTHECRVVSAHRTPQWLAEYAQTAEARGLAVIVAGAGGAAHLPGMVAAETTLPVLGVPMQTASLGGLDSLLSIVQMPRGVPVRPGAARVAAPPARKDMALGTWLSGHPVSRGALGGRARAGPDGARLPGAAQDGGLGLRRQGPGADHGAGPGRGCVGAARQ